MAKAASGSHEGHEFRGTSTRRSGDVEVGAEGAADDLAAVGVVRFSSRLDRCTELGIEANRYDLRGCGAQQWPTAPARLQDLGVVVGGLDLVGECPDVGIAQGLARAVR
jgi:hypothetical protein